MRRFILLAVLATVVAAVPLRAAEDSQSAAPAAALRTTLERLKIDAIVARDPEQPGRYVAAFYVAGSQLLVVSAPYPVPAAIDKKIAEGRYMDAYLDIQSVADHTGHFFVVDMNADGLVRVCGRDEAFDSTTLESRTPLTLDGNWVAQKLSEDEYNAAFRRDDERYARMLNVLGAALAKKITEP